MTRRVERVRVRGQARRGVERGAARKSAPSVDALTVLQALGTRACSWDALTRRCALSADARSFAIDLLLAREWVTLRPLAEGASFRVTAAGRAVRSVSQS